MYKVVGIKRLNYVSKKTNRPVAGIQLFVLFEQEGVQGHQADTIFVSNTSPCYSKAELVVVGDQVNIYYNRWGSVEGLEIAPPAAEQPKK